VVVGAADASAHTNIGVGDVLSHQVSASTSMGSRNLSYG